MFSPSLPGHMNIYERREERGKSGGACKVGLGLMGSGKLIVLTHATLKSASSNVT